MPKKMRNALMELLIYFAFKFHLKINKKIYIFDTNNVRDNEPSSKRHRRRVFSRPAWRGILGKILADVTGGAEGGLGSEKGWVVEAPVSGEMTVTSKRSSLWPPEPKRWDGQRLEKLTGAVWGGGRGAVVKPCQVL